MKNIGLLWRTVRHLTLRQVICQVQHRLRRQARLRLPETTPTTCFLAVPNPTKPVSWKPGEFTFLNLSAYFPSAIDWNYPRRGKLWTYNLTYFDFLNQPDIKVEQGLALIRDFIRQSANVRDGLEAYPTSVRIINWVQFLSRYQVRDDAINRHLFAQVRLLASRLEYHLAGNHLLENGFALLTGALYFQHERWFCKAARLIRRELTKQIMADGGHYERSPMYHQILLDRLLATLPMVQSPNALHDPALIRLLTEKATHLLGWLNAVTFRNGDIPLVNDAAPGIAPNTSWFREKAGQVLPKEAQPTGKLTDSGFRMFRQKRYELFASIGSPGPDHQPGHAHADALSFVLYVDNQPILVDNATSTYHPGPRRTWERSTEAHNTVTFHALNSSEVWAGFRVGRRARVTLLTDMPTTLTARHNGYQHRGVLHERSWSMTPDGVYLLDRLLHQTSHTESRQTGTARFYFHPSLAWHLRDDGLRVGPLFMAFHSVNKPKLLVKDYALANGFNQLMPGHCLEVTFTTRLETTLTLIG